MCGIAGIQGHATEAVNAALDEIAYRGPDARGVTVAGDWTLGHVRLAILDLDPRSDQPMQRGDTLVSYNGELWNYQDLRAELAAAGHEFSTRGDTEVIAAALDQWGPAALGRFNGMFAIAWVDAAGQLRLARDRFGEVPLHYGWTPDGRFVFASEIRAVLHLGAAADSVRWVPPGEWIDLTGTTAEPGLRRHSWYTLDATPEGPPSVADAAKQFYIELADAVADRSISDVPVACLISGGIDSSAVAHHLAGHVDGLRLYTAKHNPKSLDLRCARQFAETAELELIEVEVPPPTADDLAGVVDVIEMPHKAQVEIAWACLHLARVMHDDGIKVVFSGEGSDELWASYGSSFHGIRKLGWSGYRIDTFVGQHRKNFPRCNKVFARHSIEARLPFLHPGLVEWGIRLPQSAVNPGRKEKEHMRLAYEELLPERIVRRPKQAFQTGAGLDDAAAAAVAKPRAYYLAEFRRQFRGVAA